MQAPHAAGFQQRTLADIILQKIQDKERAQGQASTSGYPLLPSHPAAPFTSIGHITDCGLQVIHVIAPLWPDGVALPCHVFLLPCAIAHCTGCSLF